jgi:hypothetical protein
MPSASVSRSTVVTVMRKAVTRRVVVFEPARRTDTVRFAMASGVQPPVGAVSTRPAPPKRYSQPAVLVKVWLAKSNCCAPTATRRSTAPLEPSL